MNFFWRNKMSPLLGGIILCLVTFLFAVTCMYFIKRHNRNQGAVIDRNPRPTGIKFNRVFFSLIFFSFSFHTSAPFAHIYFHSSFKLIICGSQGFISKNKLKIYQHEIWNNLVLISCYLMIESHSWFYSNISIKENSVNLEMVFHNIFERNVIKHRHQNRNESNRIKYFPHFIIWWWFVWQ